MMYFIIWTHDVVGECDAMKSFYFFYLHGNQVSPWEPYLSGTQWGSRPRREGCNVMEVI